MIDTLYRRPLPADIIAFSSAQGRQVFAEALAEGGMDGYFPLAEQFHTQGDPSFCGLGSLVVALNALAIDPGRLWKGPWRWFAEDLLDCCVSLDEVRRRGLSLDELVCLARCNGADVALRRPEDDIAGWRAALGAASRAELVVVASYDRSALGQTGSGHFSPIGGYHAARDLVLVLDVARFKYPPHWISAERLWRAMRPIDPATGKTRGWMELRARNAGTALGFTLLCDGDDLQGLAGRLVAVAGELGPETELAELALALGPLASHLGMREPGGTAHRDALEATRSAVRAVAAFPQIFAAVGPERAEAVTILLLLLSDQLAAAPGSELARIASEARADQRLEAELANLRAQFAALQQIATRGTDR
jgi:glutathione gamma-glutamylcysteinyltransferase